MNVTVEVVGEGSHDLEVEDATYADLLAEVDLSPHEVSVMVDGRPVPEDQPVEADHVKVLRLIKGGTDSGSEGETGSGSKSGTDFGQESEAGPLPEFDRERESLGVSQLDFELPNAGTGRDPLRLSELAENPGNDAIVLLFHRDYRCRNCRQQVQKLADRYGEFRARDAAVVSVLPESEERAEKWQQKLHLPFPLVADEDKRVVQQYGQPTRFGRLGKLHDLVGRMPQTVILDACDKLRLYAVHRGDRPSDRPSVDSVLAMVDRLLADEDRVFADEGCTVREATPDDRIEVRRVLDAAMLEVREDLSARIEAGDVLVAERSGASETDEDSPILGALVLVPSDCKVRGTHIDAVAVRRARRGQGVGAALVRTAAEHHARLTAAFDPDVRPFYESLEFEISECEDGRLRGVLE